MQWEVGRGKRMGPQAFAQATVVVAGWGVTGQSVVEVLTELGATVVLLNANPPEPAPPAGVEVIVASDAHELANSAKAWNSHLLITSPGWAPTHPVLSQWEGPVWSDIEFAWHIAHPRTRWITVSGTNGKTTTVGMVGSILKAAGRNALVVGNVGEPIAPAAWRTQTEDIDNLVVELSSFQLHHVYSVSAVAAGVTNVADDHVDWHGSAQAYRLAKARIYQHTQGVCVYNVDAPQTREMVEDADVVEGTRAVGFTTGAPQRGEVGMVEGMLVDRAFIPNRATHAQVYADAQRLTHLAGPTGVPQHTLANALAASALTLADGVDHHAVSRGLAQFRNVAHRMQYLGEVEGVAFINDSKASNAHSSAAALGGMPDGRVVWVLGGDTKGAPVEPLIAACAHKLKAAVVLGVDPAPFSGPLSRHAPDIPTEIIDPGHDEVMTAAVKAALNFAEAGDTVLLSPAAASWDQFPNFEVRGQAFIDAVEHLTGVKL